MQQFVKSRSATIVQHSVLTFTTTMSADGEIVISAHKTSVAELCKVLNTNVETGLTNAQVKEHQKEKEEKEEEAITAQV